MPVPPIAPKPLTTSAAPAAAPQLAQKGGIRSAVATGIRGIGAGIDAGGQDMGVVTDQAALRPVEAAYALGKVIGKGMEKVPALKKYSGWAATVLGFASLIGVQSIAGVAKAPGDFAHDVTSSVADAIEGASTPKRGFGFGALIGGAGGQANAAAMGQRLDDQVASLAPAPAATAK